MSQAKTLTAQELDRVLEYIKTRPHAARNRVMLLLTVWTGMRVGEVSALTINDIRTDAGEIKDEIYLAAERVKYRHARTVYINQRMREELAKYVNSRQWIYDDQPLFSTQQSIQPKHTSAAFSLLISTGRCSRCQQSQWAQDIHNDTG